MVAMVGDEGNAAQAQNTGSMPSFEVSSSHCSGGKSRGFRQQCSQHCYSQAGFSCTCNQQLTSSAGRSQQTIQQPITLADSSIHACKKVGVRRRGAGDCRELVIRCRCRVHSRPTLTGWQLTCSCTTCPTRAGKCHWGRGHRRRRFRC